jgi:peptidyl-prolyl cis-trans isomerase D
MLEQLRRSSQSLLIYVLFGIVIAVFIINFGPQSQGGCESSVSRASYAAKVNGATVSARDFRYAYILAGGPQYQPQRAKELRIRERVLDELLERELLTAEADRLGFAVSEEEVEDLIAQGKLVGLGGFEQTAAAMQKDGHFDYDSFVRFVQFQLGISPKAFIDQQRREMLAARVRHLVRNGVNVSDHEVKGEFERQSNQVNLEYVRFSWRRHEDGIELAAGEIEAYAKANEKKLKELYDQRKFLYENAPKERRLRQIVLKLDSGASADAIKAVEKKAQLLLERTKKEGFAAVAKATSEDPRSKLRGGDVGWRRQGATPYGAALEEKVWAAKDGEVVGPMKGNDGMYLVLPEASREGNITFEQVRPDLAETELRQERAKAKAKVEADAALVKAKAAKDKTLKDLYPAAADASGHGSEGVPRTEETGLYSRRGTIVEGIGMAPELAKAAFELKPGDPLAGPYEVSGSWVIVRLKEKKEPDLAEFDKKKGELLHQAAMARGEEILAEWTQRRCVEAKEAKRISVNNDILRYDDSPTERVAYEPCTPPFRF